MAIGLQLQAESAQQNNTSLSTAVVLGAGQARLFVVGVVGERTSYAAPTSVTYGGNALALITDGTQTAQNITGSFGGVHFYSLKEASLPADGSNTLAVTWPGAAVNYAVGWWILTGCDQGNVVDVKVLGQTTTATSITVTLDAGQTTDAVLCAFYKNDTTGTVAITISGAGVTEDFDISLTTGGARAAAGTDLPPVAAGTIACVATVSSTARRILVGVRLAEGGSAALTASASFQAQSATSAADVSRSRVATVSFQAGDATSSTSAARGREASVSFASAAATSAETAVRGHPIGVAFAAGPAGFASTADVSGNKTVSASFLAGPASFLTSAIRPRTAQGAFSAQPATFAASAQSGANRLASVAFTAGPAASSVTLVRGRSASASFQASPALAFARADIPIADSGNELGVVGATVRHPRSESWIEPGLATVRAYGAKSTERVN